MSRAIENTSTSPALSPRLAELKIQFTEAAAAESSARERPPVDWDDEWEDARKTLSDVALDVMREPVASLDDLAFKLAVWRRAVWDPHRDSDDMTAEWGWIDRAPFRLLNDARKLLAAQAGVAVRVM